jgi:hypothetical protein
MFHELCTPPPLRRTVLPPSTGNIPGAPTNQITVGRQLLTRQYIPEDNSELGDMMFNYTLLLLIPYNR